MIATINPQFAHGIIEKYQPSPGKQPGYLALIHRELPSATESNWLIQNFFQSMVHLRLNVQLLSDQLQVMRQLSNHFTVRLLERSLSSYQEKALTQESHSRYEKLIQNSQLAALFHRFETVRSEGVRDHRFSHQTQEVSLRFSRLLESNGFSFLNHPFFSQQSQSNAVHQSHLFMHSRHSSNGANLPLDRMQRWKLDGERSVTASAADRSIEFHDWLQQRFLLQDWFTPIRSGNNVDLHQWHSAVRSEKDATLIFLAGKGHVEPTRLFSHASSSVVRHDRREPVFGSVMAYPLYKSMLRELGITASQKWSPFFQQEESNNQQLSHIELGYLLHDVRSDASYKAMDSSVWQNRFKRLGSIYFEKLFTRIPGLSFFYRRNSGQQRTRVLRPENSKNDFLPFDKMIVTGEEVLSVSQWFNPLLLFSVSKARRNHLAAVTRNANQMNNRSIFLLNQLLDGRTTSHGEEGTRADWMVTNFSANDVQKGVHENQEWIKRFFTRVQSADSGQNAAIHPESPLTFWLDMPLTHFGFGHFRQPSTKTIETRLHRGGSSPLLSLMQDRSTSFLNGYQEQMNRFVSLFLRRDRSVNHSFVLEKNDRSLSRENTRKVSFQKEYYSRYIQGMNGWFRHVASLLREEGLLSIQEYISTIRKLPEDWQKYMMARFSTEQTKVVYPQSMYSFSAKPRSKSNELLGKTMHLLSMPSSLHQSWYPALQMQIGDRIIKGVGREQSTQSAVWNIAQRGSGLLYLRPFSSISTLSMLEMNSARFQGDRLLHSLGGRDLQQDWRLDINLLYSTLTKNIIERTSPLKMVIASKIERDSFVRSSSTTHWIKQAVSRLQRSWANGKENMWQLFSGLTQPISIHTHLAFTRSYTPHQANDSVIVEGANLLNYRWNHNLSAKDQSQNQINHPIALSTTQVEQYVSIAKMLSLLRERLTHGQAKETSFFQVGRAVPKAFSFTKTLENTISRIQDGVQPFLFQLDTAYRILAQEKRVHQDHIGNRTQQLFHKQPHVYQVLRQLLAQAQRGYAQGISYTERQLGNHPAHPTTNQLQTAHTNLNIIAHRVSPQEKGANWLANRRTSVLGQQRIIQNMLERQQQLLQLHKRHYQPERVLTNLQTPLSVHVNQQKQLTLLQSDAEFANNLTYKVSLRERLNIEGHSGDSTSPSSAFALRYMNNQAHLDPRNRSAGESRGVASGLTPSAPMQHLKKHVTAAEQAIPSVASSVIRQQEEWSVEKQVAEQKGLSKVEMDRLVERMMKELDKRLTLERQRRGM